MLTQPGYRPRLVDAEIAANLETFGAVCVEGPKWCGKTWAALNQSRSVFYVGDPAGNFQNRMLAELDPSLVLRGDSPRLVDEWQEVPSIWDAVRFEVDQTRARGRFLLSGSSTPQRKGVLHSGTGRIGTIRMHPMSLAESGDSAASVSLAALFGEGSLSAAVEPMNLERIVDLVIRGGWPGNLDVPRKNAGLIPSSYVRQVAEEDIARIDGKARDPHKVMLLLRSLARNESTLVSNATLRRDIKEFDDDSVSEDSIAEYLSLLRRMFVVWEQPAFDPNMRSSVRVRKSPKRHLADPSLAAAALGVTPDRLTGDLKTLGFLFEALCERDLAVYAQAAGGALYHYRDASGREIDAVVELPDGRWGAFEIKLGANQIDAAASHLLSVKRVMEEDPQAKPPSILVVICGLSPYAYKRPDGVMVVPVTALGA